MKPTKFISAKIPIIKFISTYLFQKMYNKCPKTFLIIQTYIEL